MGRLWSCGACLGVRTDTILLYQNCRKIQQTVFGPEA